MTSPTSTPPKRRPDASLPTSAKRARTSPFPAFSYPTSPFPSTPEKRHADEPLDIFSSPFKRLRPPTDPVSPPSKLSGFRTHLSALSDFLRAVSPSSEHGQWRELRSAVDKAYELSGANFFAKKRTRDEAELGDRRQKKLKRNCDHVWEVAGRKRGREEEVLVEERVEVGLKRPRATYRQEGDPEIEYQSSVEASDSDDSDDDDMEDKEESAAEEDKEVNQKGASGAEKKNGKEKGAAGKAKEGGSASDDL